MKLISTSSLIIPVGCALLSLSLIGCTRTVGVTKEMTWECAPDEYKEAYYARPNEYVRFRYLEEPHCFEVESARNLCAELRSIGKPVVSVDFEVSGGVRLFARQGFNVVSVEHRPLTDIGGWGNSGSNDFTGVCPIGKVIDDLSGGLNRISRSQR